MLNTKGTPFQYLNKGRESLSYHPPLPMVKGITMPSSLLDKVDRANLDGPKNIFCNNIH